MNAIIRHSSPKLAMLKFDACATIRILGLGKHVRGWQPKENLRGAIVTLKDGCAAKLVAACDNPMITSFCDGGFWVAAQEADVTFVVFEPADFQEQDSGSRFHLYELPTGEYCADDRERKEDNHWRHRDCQESVAKWILNQLGKGSAA